MVRVIFKRVPGQHAVDSFRINFSSGPTDRGIDYIYSGDLVGMKRFLEHDLELDPARVALVLNSVAAGQVASAEIIDWQMPDAMSAVRGWAKAAKDAMAADGTPSGSGSAKPAVHA